MRTLTALLPLLLSTVDCAITATDEEIAAATLYVPPNFKYLDKARFSFSVAERERALQAFERSDADTLFEFVVDPQGNVERVRIVKTHVRRDYQPGMVDNARFWTFGADPTSERFRAFFVFMEYSVNPEFEWI
ncbi:MAG: hypothetical protein AAGI22_20025 [Planctomycetota bacterium]